MMNVTSLYRYENLMFAVKMISKSRHALKSMKLLYKNKDKEEKIF